MRNTNTTIEEVLKKSYLNLQWADGHLRSDFNSQVSIDVEEMKVTGVKACINRVKYVIMFTMLEAEFLNFVQNDAGEFLMSIIEQSPVADANYVGTERVQDNKIIVYYDITIDIGFSRRK